MTKDDLMQEMLTEIKNLKDLTKEELPLIAQEYIHANRVSCALGVGLGLSMLLLAGAIAVLGFLHVPNPDRYDDVRFGCSLAGLLLGAVGFVTAVLNVSHAVDFYLQPRRMAIKAITSLMG